jgi:hypothetical protein
MPDLTGYEVGDYLLLDPEGEIQAVSGNSDFWDEPGCPIPEDEEFTIVKIITHHKIGG